MGFAQLNLHDYYRSGENNIVKDFYMPCLSAAVQYDRAVGYFNSGALKLALRGISRLVRNKGRLRLVVSPALTAADLKAIEDGYATRQVIDDVIVRTVQDVLVELPTHQLELLRWLIANNYLDIRVATVMGQRPAIYHEKFGIFTDPDGLRVVFVGSSNETPSGLLANFESVEVFRSWYDDDVSRITRRVQNFDDLWEGRERGLEVTPFPDAARRVIIESGEARATLDAFDDDLALGNGQPHGQDTRPSLRDYQLDAVRAWLRNQGRGVLAMATGTGKTITALSIVDLLVRDFRRKEQALTIIIVVPYKHLVTQWNETALQFGFSPILCFESRQLWEGQAQAEVRAVQHGTSPHTILIVTTTTFISEPFQAVMKIATAHDALLVVDEVHNVGATSTRTLLSDDFTFRLGLSATPERVYDAEGTSALLAFFGGVVFEIDLAEAIRRAILVPYRYYVHRVFLTDDESDQYIQLTDQLTRLGGYHDNADPEDVAGDQVKRLLIRRARIVGSASNKVPVFLGLIQKEEDHRYTLVYCGDGKTDGDERLVHNVVAGLTQMHRSADSYTATTPLDTRDWLRKTFAAGDLEYLVAIRCLDEGIDIPETRRAYFLASSTNPRQFIQRRGRVLRRSNATGKRYAEIHDLLALLSPTAKSAGTGYAQSVILRELGRVREFAKLAQNGPQVIASLLDLPVAPGDVI